MRSFRYRLAFKSTLMVLSIIVLVAISSVATAESTLYVFADFENGDMGTFTYRPGYSGSSSGFIDASSTSATDDTQAGEGLGSLKLTITDDPNNSNEWFARIVSGRLASRTENTIRVADGYVGLMAMTETADTYISIAVDDPGTGDRGLRKSLIADGEWHWYEWNLDDAADWEAWLSIGDGEINNVDFTLDSIQVWGSTDAVIYLDQVSHDSAGPVESVPEPSTLALLLTALTGVYFLKRRR